MILKQKLPHKNCREQYFGDNEISVFYYIQYLANNEQRKNLFY